VSNYFHMSLKVVS